MPLNSLRTAPFAQLRWLVAYLVVAFAAGVPASGLAADAELVGLLALAVEEEAAEKLDLSDDQIARLYDLLDRREEAALAVAPKLRGFSPEERAEELRPLRVESQRQMAGILNDAQLTSLSEMAEEQDNPFYEPLGSARVVASGAAHQPRAAPDGVTPAEAEGTSSDAPEPQTDTEELFDPPQAAEAPPSATESADEESQAPPVADPLPAASGDGKLSFNFRYQPWQDVLDWFAEQADLSLVLESPPSGTFNYTDSRRYTPAEALDVLNSVLLTKGYTLVRRDRMLVLVNLEDGIPPNLVTDVPLEELDERGEYELVRVLFQVRNMTPEAASEEISRMIGPQGSVVVLPRAGMLQVTETAGRIRAIQKVIESIESPSGSMTGSITLFELEHASAASVMPVLRQMLGIAADEFSTPDDRLKLAIDTSTGNRILAYGTPEMMDRLKEVLELVDVPEAGGGPLEALQLEVYPVNQADPEAALLVLQTLMADEPGTRLATDPKTGNLVALATPSNHATIRATLGQMQEDARQIEVIPLNNVDPQLALLSITKLFGIASGEEVDPRAPVVDADLSSRTLLVRGSQSQIAQIRALLDKMGESEEPSLFSGTERGNVRLLPLSASEARTAVEQLESIWPTIRPNPVRLVSPATAIRSYRPGEAGPTEEPTSERYPWDELFQFESPDTTPAEGASSGDRGASKSTNSSTVASVKFAVYQQEQQQPAEAPQPGLTPQAAAGTAQQPVPNSNPGAPIMVAPGPNGLLIASDDLEALDAYERLLEAAVTQATSSGREYAVFYLKHAKAATAAAILSDIFGGTSSAGGDMMSGIADAALGDIGGGLMGDLLGLGGGGSSTGFSAASVDIVTDARLNALIVYARPDDIEMVNRLLQILDQRIGPMDVEADGVARLIPVYNTSAAQIAEVVKQIYANRLESGPGGQPSPEDLLRALRRGGPNGGGSADAQEPAKMSIGVDARSNSLVVRAPDSLFTEVEGLVRKLDSEQEGSTQSTQIMSLKFTNTEAVKQALGTILGDQAVTTTPQQAGQQSGGGDDNNREAEEARRRQQEMIRRIQEFRQRMQGGGGDGGRGRGGDRGGRGGRGRR